MRLPRGPKSPGKQPKPSINNFIMAFSFRIRKNIKKKTPEENGVVPLLIFWLQRRVTASVAVFLLPAWCGGRESSSSEATFWGLTHTPSQSPNILGGLFKFRRGIPNHKPWGGLLLGFTSLKEKDSVFVDLIFHLWFWIEMTHAHFECQGRDSHPWHTWFVLAQSEMSRIGIGQNRALRALMCVWLPSEN